MLYWLKCYIWYLKLVLSVLAMQLLQQAPWSNSFLIGLSFNYVYHPQRYLALVYMYYVCEKYFVPPL